MATAAHQYRGASTVRQAGVPERMHLMHTDANAPPCPPSAQPRAFPLSGPARTRTAHKVPASEVASELDSANSLVFANVTLAPSINLPLAAMQPLPLFSKPVLSAERSLDAAMVDTKPPVGARDHVHRSSNGAAAYDLTSGSGLNEIDNPLHTDLEIRRSVCQSPSWEAYTQRKQDKKGAKKQKEQASKEARSKPRRLSKPPPPSSTFAPRSCQNTRSEQNITGSSTSRHQSRDRSDGELGLIEPPPIGSSSRTGRSRSSSFSSLIKSTFEIRRPSIDLTLDSGFIGGIKLEQHIIAAEEEHRREEARLEKEDELGIHPALRSKKSELQPEPTTTRPPNSTRSRYPPSTWKTSPSAASLISPSTPQLPEPSTIKKWRTRVGLSTKQAAQSPDNVNEGTIHIPTEAERHFTSIPAARNSSPALGVHTRHSLDSPRSHIQASGSVLELPALSNWPGPYSASPPPPEPPQKSSKRQSIGSLNSPTSLKSSFGRLETADRNPNAYANVIARTAPRRASIDMAPASELITNGRRRSFKEAARAAFGKAPVRPSISVLPNHQTGNRTVSANATNVRLPELLRRAQTSSSEGSLSDEYQSTGSATTNATTPDTSRPQSERGIFSIAPKIGTVGERNKSAARRSESSPGPASTSRAATEDELDPIQAAAQKVRAAFPEAGTRPKGPDRRAQSDSVAQREVPRLRHPTLKSTDRNKTKVPFDADSLEGDASSPDMRELILSKDQSSVAAPWPASYLEAARKAAPAAPVPRNKPTNFPSPSLSTLSGLAPPSPRSQVFTLSAFDNSGGQSPVRTSASSFTGSGTALSATSGSGSEPLAKMFVECCGCRYYHDMPSKLYEAMSNPEGALGGQAEFVHSPGLSMTVRCPWCQHDMSTRCCAGLAAMVYVKERLH